VTADELLAPRPPNKARQNTEHPNTTRLWKKFQQVQELPEKDQRAVIRLVNSLVSAQRSQRSNGTAARR
jgi:hypothetical protein